jgi:hypothetical protein
MIPVRDTASPKETWDDYVEEARVVAPQRYREAQDDYAYAPYRPPIVVNPPQSRRRVPMLAGVTMSVLGVLILALIGYRLLTTNAQKAYRANASAFAAAVLSSGTNLEYISDYILEKWHDGIYDDSTLDFNTEIRIAVEVMSDRIAKAEKEQEEIKTLYDVVRRVPSLAGSDETEEICDAVKTMYNTYTDFYSFAITPTGSYQTYSAANSAKADEFASKYRALTNLLD